jgi:histidinol-phosphate/aromatic aminotransferase/cobyric acid decarboxylase-like protein
MNKLKATRTVYCYYFPEIRRIIDRTVKDYPHQTFLKSIEPGLDNLQDPVIERFIKFNSGSIPALANFRYRYFTNGSSEAIFHILALHRITKPDEKVYVLGGEYEGYREYAKCIDLRINEADIQSLDNLEKGLWLISNPSSRDGNIIPNETIMRICEAGHKVILDCSYVGLTRPHVFEANHPNIVAVLCSMSKPFGLFYYRIGFAFSRFKIESLESNKWFKNVLSIIIANNILSEIEPGYFYKKYIDMQKNIVDELNAEFRLNMAPSDSILLGYIDKESAAKLPTEILSRIGYLKRGDYYRFCLTPYFLKREVGK